MSSTDLCPVCNGDSLSIIPRTPEAELIRCNDCSHAFSKLLVEEEDYGPDYYEEAHKNWFAHPNFPLFKIIGNLLTSAGAQSVLDVGCGDASFLKYLRDSCEIGALCGIDLSKSVPERGIEIIEGDFIAYDFDRKFDAVVSLAVIEHVSDVRSFVERLKALLNPGGTLIVMTLNDAGLLYWSSRLLRTLSVKMPYERLYEKHHVNHFNKKSLHYLIQSSGLTVQQTINHNTPIRAIDTPSTSTFTSLILRAGILTIYALGTLTGACYLQTIVATQPSSPE